MARVKLTEYKAKQILFQQLELSYDGVSASVDSIPHLSSKHIYVVKVDQGIKGRMKKGLVKLHISNDKLKNTIQSLSKKGFSQFIVEPMVSYDSADERYISMERTREGIVVHFAKVGGIDIEEKQNEVKSVVCHSDKVISDISKELGVPIMFIHQLLNYFEYNYISFLEINPLVVGESGMHILDLAVEVDSTAEFFTKSWGSADIVEDTVKSPEELAIKKLNDQSQAAFSFTLLNTTGLLWVLLSGGGASITIADEAYNMGFGKELANYGEYSGNPNDDETYEYTCSLIDSMMKSSRRRLMLIIGGGVANFTDIGKTFKGVIKALEKNKKRLKKKHIKIFVRRGGPHQKKGLKMMEKWLKENDMYGVVSGPELPLHEIMKQAINKLQ
jgi:ATP-citrate lyase beta-subunit